MIDFKFEVGMFVKLRGGMKAEILKIFTDYKKPIFGIVQDDKGCITRDWTRYGNFYEQENVSEWDIVGIWEEPKPKRLCYVELDFGYIRMMTEDEFIKARNNKLERFPCVLDEV